MQILRMSDYSECYRRNCCQCQLGRCGSDSDRGAEKLALIPGMNICKGKKNLDEVQPRRL